MPPFRPELLDELLEDYQKPEDLPGQPGIISTVTDAVLDDVRARQTRPLDAAYPILYPDALQVKVRSQGRFVNKAIHLAEHDRVFEHDAAQNQQEPAAVPVGRGGLRTAVAGLARHQQEVDNADPNWSGALNRFAILFDGRVPVGGLGSSSLTQNA
jgi:hypothetical protein